MRHNAPHIEGSRPAALAKKVRESRERQDLSVYALAKSTGIHRSTLQAIEDGSVRNPSPEILARIAEQLDITMADLYSLAGYAVPAELPDFDGYMSAKFRGLPAEAIDELTGHLKYLAAKHGLDPTGPNPGEDEQ